MKIAFLVFISLLFTVTLSCFPKQDDDGYGDKDNGYGEGKDSDKGGGYGNGDKLFGYSDHGYVDEGFGHTRFEHEHSIIFQIILEKVLFIFYRFSYGHYDHDDGYGDYHGGGYQHGYGDHQHDGGGGYDDHEHDGYSDHDGYNEHDGYGEHDEHGYGHSDHGYGHKRGGVEGHYSYKNVNQHGHMTYHKSPDYHEDYGYYEEDEGKGNYPEYEHDRIDKDKSVGKHDLTLKRKPALQSRA